MRTPSRRGRLGPAALIACSIAAVLCLDAVPAEAQLDRLRNARDRAERIRNGGTETEEAATATTSPYGENVLELTDEVLDLVERGLTAEADALVSFRAWAATTKSPEAYGQCQMEAAMSPEGQEVLALAAAMEGKEGDALLKAMEEYNQRWQAHIESACGPSPETVQARADEAGAAARERAVEASGLEPTQFSIAKERIVAACQPGILAAAGPDGLRFPGEGNNIAWVYSAAEVAALTPRCDALAARLGTSP